MWRACAAPGAAICREEIEHAAVTLATARRALRLSLVGLHWLQTSEEALQTLEGALQTSDGAAPETNPPGSAGGGGGQGGQGGHGGGSEADGGGEASQGGREGEVSEGLLRLLRLQVQLHTACSYSTYT